MSDNISLMQGSGTLLAADDVDGVKVLRVKVQTGADGVAADVSSDTPMPVSVVTGVSVSSMPSVSIQSMPSVVVGSSLPAGTSRIGDVGIATMPSLPAGSNNIGKVTVASLPSVVVGSSLPAGTSRIGDVGVVAMPSLPAGINNIGSVSVASLPSVTIGSSLPAGASRIGDVGVVAMPSLPAGINNIGSVSVASLPNVTIGTQLPAGVNKIGAVDVASLPTGVVNLKPTTSGGLAAKHIISLSKTPVSVKGTAGQVYGWHISNISASGTAYVKLYNMVTPVVGTSVPVMTLYLPFGQSVHADVPCGIDFPIAIAIAATAGYADTDAVAPDCIVIANLLYA